MAAIPFTEARVWYAPESDEDRFLPEGPREFADANRAVGWVDIQTAEDATTGAVFAWFDGADRPVRIPAPGRPGFILPTDRPGRLLVGVGKELRVLDVWGESWSDPLAVIPDANPRTILNDAEVVPGGDAVVFGTKDTRFADPIAHVYLFTPADGKVTVLAGGQTCSNGKVFARDADGLVLFDIDTPKQTVARYRLDVASRTLTPDGVAVDLRGEPALPDGMCDAGDGTVVVAVYDTRVLPHGRAVRYRLADGSPVEEWRTPGSPRVTCPLVVGRPDGVKLILTTAVEGMPAGDRARCPNAGCLFVADTGLSAAPPAEAVRLPG